MTELSPRDLPFSQEGQRRQCAPIKDVAMCSLSSHKWTLFRDIPTNEKEHDILMSRDAYYLRRCKY
jgi:hypothetical protein